VHADFSEYNILYHEGHAHIIDVSQAGPGRAEVARRDIQRTELNDIL